MRRIVAALVVAMLAVSISGCGGGGTETTETGTEAVNTAEQTANTAEQAQTGGATAAPEDEGMQALADNSPTETVTYEPLVPAGVTPPPSVAQRIKERQPFVLVFYDNDQPVTDDQKRVIARVQKKYRGLTDLVSFDIGKFVTTGSSGLPEVDEDLLKEENETTRQAVELATALKVNYTPFVIVVDKFGYTTYRGRGLVDNGTLEREVLRVGE
ncbi:MAG: hypothetical protein HY876_03085 [Coriobacteriales bacterium]|nr:hypothetical protein [Coriobacteriales bacterium]